MDVLIQVPFTSVSRQLLVIVSSCGEVPVANAIDDSINKASFALSLKPGFKGTDGCACLPVGADNVETVCDDALVANMAMHSATTAPRVPANTSVAVKVLINSSCTRPIAQIPNMAFIIDERWVTNNPMATNPILSVKAKLG